MSYLDIAYKVLGECPNAIWNGDRIADCNGTTGRASIWGRGIGLAIDMVRRGQKLCECALSVCLTPWQLLWSSSLLLKLKFCRCTALVQVPERIVQTPFQLQKPDNNKIISMNKTTLVLVNSDHAASHQWPKLLHRLPTHTASTGRIEAQTPLSPTFPFLSTPPPFPPGFVELFPSS